MERPGHEAVRMELALSWRPHNVGGVRAMGSSPRRAADRAWNQPKSTIIEVLRHPQMHRATQKIGK